MAYTPEEQKEVAEEIAEIVSKWSYIRKLVELNFSNNDAYRKAVQIGLAEVIKVKLQQFAAEELDVILTLNDLAPASEEEEDSK